MADRGAMSHTPEYPNDTVMREILEIVARIDGSIDESRRPAGLHVRAQILIAGLERTKENLKALYISVTEVDPWNGV